jgi:hypothetical protein
MTPEEIIRHLPLRPGYRLADYAEVGLPVYKISCRIFTQSQKRIPAIEEFTLRLISVGLQDTRDIAAFLGLQTALVDETLSDLLVQELIGLGGGSDGQQRLSLTTKGVRDLVRAETMVPEEKTQVIEYDAICRKVATYGKDHLLSAKQARQYGLKQIRPLIRQQLSIADLPPHDVQRAIEVKGERRETKTYVLAIKEFFRKQLYFLQALGLIYRAVDGDEIQVAFIIDGQPSPEHDAAFARIDGVHLLGIDREFSTLRNTEELQQLVEEAATVAREMEPPALPESQIAQASRQQNVMTVDPLVHLAPEQKRDLEQRGFGYLAVQDHPALLEYAIKECHERLVVICPFLHEMVVTAGFIGRLESLLRNGRSIYIGYGMPDKDGRRPSRGQENVIIALQKLMKKYSRLKVAKVGSHAKILLVDTTFLALGSFNWLSFHGDPERPFRDEQSVLITIPVMIEKKFRDLLSRFT